MTKRPASGLRRRGVRSLVLPDHPGQVTRSGRRPQSAAGTVTAVSSSKRGSRSETRPSWAAILVLVGGVGYQVNWNASGIFQGTVAP